MNNRNYIFWIIIILGTGFLLPIVFASEWRGVLDIKNITAGKTGNILAQLALYALVVERVTEVYINTTFNKYKADLKKLDAVETRKVHILQTTYKSQQNALEEQKQTLTALNAAKLDLEKKRQDANVDAQWIDLTNRIKKHASIFGMLVGIALALVGARVLGSVAASETLSTHQSTLLAGADVLITGMLLAGGAEGLHPLLNKVKSLTSNKG